MRGEYLETMPPKSEPSNKDPSRFDASEEFAQPAVIPTATMKPRRGNKIHNVNQGTKRERIIGPCEDVTLPCEDGQRYIDPSDCRSYYVCASRHRLVRLTCPLGTAWHHKARVCVDDRNIYNNGICDKNYPSHRCPRDNQIKTKRLPTTPGLSRRPDNTTTRNATISLNALGKSNISRRTSSRPLSKTEMIAKSKATTLKPNGMEAPPNGQLERSDAEMIVIAVVGGLIFAALIAIILVLIWRKRRDEKSSENGPSPVSEQKTPNRCIDNPEYSRRNSAIYAEIDDALRGPLMTSTISRARGKAMCARLERTLPPLATLPEPMRPHISAISSTMSSCPTHIYSETLPESEQEADRTFYEKLSTNNSDSNIQSLNLDGYDYVGNSTGHLYSTLGTKPKDTRYELLNEMSSASANPSENQTNSSTSSPALQSSRARPDVPTDYFILDNPDPPAADQTPLERF